eukprot:CAMPEP_0194041382 /NCGR_PEP_ID=MMETSP0009_2-20130614/13303_1 /TAXON_ID=210454 /ORGANISM="Grammatophora oceanica, Strain CCMP 410" /LENGTH=362 /DNA_ID=CAMNT_0038684879 /DNA_START=441 /DNA_END=1529 /DNA_ORIENTATION=+
MTTTTSVDTEDDDDVATTTTAAAAASSSTLGLITFDLDNTLFAVEPVVKEANAAQIKAMHEAGFPTTNEQTIAHQTRQVRSKVKKRITYTNLRKKAIRAEMERHDNGSSSSSHFELVNDLFHVWLNERHASAERHLLDGAIEMLKALRATYPEAYIGAVTNARGNPLDMPNTLAPYFDFCVSGEDPDVFPERKPHKGIFHATLDVYSEMRRSSEKETNMDETDAAGDVVEDETDDDDASSSSLRWIHVGDCLGNDVWGSAQCGAMTIWMEYVSENPSSFSSATASINKQRLKLAAKGGRHVDQRITKLSELPKAVEVLLETAANAEKKMKSGAGRGLIEKAMASKESTRSGGPRPRANRRKR